MDWRTIVKPNDLSFILGNPPFRGSKFQDEKQKQELSMIFNGSKNSRILDYVTGWYAKAAEYIQGTNIKVAFVSTNSITQGEQVGPLWELMINKYHVHILFAHRTFKWSSEARGKAAVHCVIIGFSTDDTKDHIIFDYESPEAEAYKVEAKRINPYLVDAPDIFIFSRSRPIGNVPRMSSGCQPIDNGNYLFERNEKDRFLMKEPNASKWIRPFIGSIEYINGYQRYCLLLRDCPPEDLKVHA